jgi:diguanylate cyclase (GGDEF)-like protein
MRWRSGRRIFSLRYRLLSLVLLAVLPALTLVVLTAWEQRRQAAAGAQADALRLARLASTTHDRLAEGARSLLTGLAQLSDVQMHSSRACSALFADVQKQFPLYTNLGAVRPDGQLFCVARRAAAGGSASDRASLARARTTREFAVSGYVLDRATGKPVLTLAYPAVDGSGAVWAVVFAEIDLTWLQQLAERAGLPQGSVISVTDPAGLVLARYPEPGNWIGKRAPESAVVRAIQAEQGEGTLEARGLDGTPRLYAYTPLGASAQDARAYVSVGIPRRVALAEADRLLLRNLLWAALVMLLILVGALIFSDLFILRRVSAVVRAARRLTAGDLSARAEVHGADEIGVMARTFNVMAERLEERVRDERLAKEGLAGRVNELDLLNRMGELLQSCMSLDEAYGVIHWLAQRLFQTETGAVFVLNASRNVLEARTAWGAHPAEPDAFAPEDCWALRNGQSHVVEDTGTGVLCQHLPSPPPRAYLCTPLVAQGKALGLLYVGSEPAGAAGRWGLPEAKQRLAEAVAAQLGLGLANVQLREILRSQSIRDPLTGLFNRRYMEETLEREVHRARRSGRPMAVLMLDVDGFKHQNDTFGHDAGDAVLRELAALLLGNLRRGDIACRYGGEEFVLVLPEASLEDGARRAEQLRGAVTRLHLSHNERVIGPITISAGVAAFPDHGIDAETVIRAADMALYRAKREGRDRVAVATSADRALAGRSAGGPGREGGGPAGPDDALGSKV